MTALCPQPQAVSSPGEESVATLRRQESALIVLNLVALGVLIVIHGLFAAAFRTSVRLAVSLFAVRFLMQMFELAWLRGRFGYPSPERVRRYAVASIWMNILFAGVVSVASGLPDSHYIVLMLLPTIAAAFRFHWLGLAAVVAVAIGVTFVYVPFYSPDSAVEARTDEYFEAATATLIYLVVAVVVRLLVVQLRAEQEQLQRNLLELRQTRDQLVTEAKLSAVGRLAAAVAHEIRNPVGMMASAVAAAQRMGYEPTVRDEMFAIVQQETRRLERLTDDFLSFARPAAPRPQPTSMLTTLEYVAALVGARAAERGVTVEVHCPADVETFVDPAQVHQALLNLVTNALDATPAAGTVTLGLETDNVGRVLLFVANTGAPISADALARLFEPFFTTKPRGTGLGLAISRKIAREHGGDLLLTDNEPGHVRFSLSLPPLPDRLPRRSEVPHGADPDRG